MATPTLRVTHPQQLELFPFRFNSGAVHVRMTTSISSISGADVDNDPFRFNLFLWNKKWALPYVLTDLSARPQAVRSILYQSWSTQFLTEI